jgi:hypothetical protein
MKKRVVVVMAAMAMAMAMWVGGARADTLADGSIAATGNPVVDVAIAAANVLKKGMDIQEDFGKFWLERKKTETALQQNLDSLRTAREKLPELKKALFDQADALRKGTDISVMEARGDKAKEAEAEKKAKARAKELDQALKDIGSAEAEMAKQEQLGQKLLSNVQGMDTTDEATALKQWPQLRKQLVTINNKMKAGGAKAGTLLATAGAAIQKGSTLNPNNEAVGAFSVKVVSLTGKKTELFINGTKVTQGQTIGVGKEGKLELRAMLVDSRRTQARKFAKELAAGTSSMSQVKVTAADEYNLAYSNGKKASSWTVEKETYEWKEAETRTGAKLMQTARASGKVAKNDIYDVTFPSGTASETIRGYVTGSIDWKGPTVDSDTEGVSYELQITPAR